MSIKNDARIFSWRLGCGQIKKFTIRGAEDEK